MQREVLQAPPSKDVGRLSARAPFAWGPQPPPLLLLSGTSLASPTQTHRPKREAASLWICTMVCLEASLLLFFLCQAFSMPVPTQLSKDDETVVKCISEILADTLSRSSPMPVTSNCMKILREDDRVLTMLHHRHLLTELEDLAHQENTKHLLAQETDRHSPEGKRRGELQKQEEPSQQKEAEKREEHAGETKEEKKEEEEEQKKKEEEEKKKEEEEKKKEEEEKKKKEEKEEEKKKEEEKEEEEEKGEEVTKKGEKIEDPKEKTEDSQEEDLQEALKEQEEEEEEEEEGDIKKRTSSETWHSKEYFGHVKRRGSRLPKIRKGDGQERPEMGKRRFRMDEEERDGTSEEEKKKYHPGGHSDDEKWERGEERRSAVAKRVAEKASDEETAQFEEEEEEKGLKSSKSKAHLHKGWKPWQEDAEEEEENHNKAPAVDKLEEIERELKWAADKLEELKKG